MELHARLVHAEAGHRVVEVKATQGERSLGSALAEASTAQEAEDLAMARLLHRLQVTPAGLLDPGYLRGSRHAPAAQSEASMVPDPSAPLSGHGPDLDPSPDRQSPGPHPLQADLPLPAPPAVPAAVNRRQAAPIRHSADKAAAAERSPARDPAIGTGGSVLKAEGAVPDPTVVGSPLPPSAPPETQLPPRSEQPQAPPPAPSVPPEAPQSDPEEEPPADPEDWSQELAALELHLRRLGWGREEEGAYLQRAFGHPSRSRLTRYNDLRAYLLALEGLERGSDPAVAAVPLRRSELVAQGDALLARLGWSADQGRAFLERELQRVSRRQLSDVQLLQFNMLLEGELLTAGEADVARSGGPGTSAAPAPTTVTTVTLPVAPASLVAEPVEAQR